jgi:hypothetical protein
MVEKSGNVMEFIALPRNVLAGGREYSNSLYSAGTAHTQKALNSIFVSLYTLFDEDNAKTSSMNVVVWIDAVHIFSNSLLFSLTRWLLVGFLILLWFLENCCEEPS